MTADGSGNSLSSLLAGLTAILVCAKLGGELMVRFGLPQVLGELFVGIALGNLVYLGIDFFEPLKHDQVLHSLSELGVIFLLFQVGLHSSVGEMARVGRTAALVAVIGVIFPLLLGIGVAFYFIPQEPLLAHVFVGATLTATSVGITARVLADLKKMDLQESKIILGAAVIDDVLGLLVLAVVSSAIRSANAGVPMSVAAVGKLFALCIGFFLVALLLGRRLSRGLFRFAASMQSEGALLAGALIFCFAFSYLAGLAGLAPIVGAFTAGTLLEPNHYREFREREDPKSIDDLIAPIGELLIPIFFVMMGAGVDLIYLTKTDLLVFAGVLTAAAIIGKQACSLAVRDKTLDGVLVGLGMIPRGEVGLIFAGIGATLVLEGQPVVIPSTYAAVVIMVIVTTLITPVLLKARLARK